MIEAQLEHDGAVMRITLGPAPGNILDRAGIAKLRRILRDLPDTSTGLRLVTIEGAGKHFSFGASVPEHLPGEVQAMLPAFHALLRELLEAPAPTVALVRGSCLGGGLELAAACDVLFAEAGARLGQPEVKLGVFAPAASVFLPLRIPHAAAAELLLTGRSVTGRRAHELGLVAQLADDGGLSESFGVWLQKHILPRSAVALKLAAAASRATIVDQAGQLLQRVEDLYLEALVPTNDASEGIRSFMEKRPPVWRHA